MQTRNNKAGNTETATPQIFEYFFLQQHQQKSYAIQHTISIKPVTTNAAYSMLQFFTR